MNVENECTNCVTYVPIVGAMCSQCVIDEVDTKLEDLLNSVKGHHLKKLEDQIVAIKDEIHPLVSC